MTAMAEQNYGYDVTKKNDKVLPLPLICLKRNRSA